VASDVVQALGHRHMAGQWRTMRGDFGAVGDVGIKVWN
jgi:hypothetical protein